METERSTKAYCWGE